MKNYRRQRKGQALIVVAFAIIALIAFVGLGVDLGLAYVERVRVQRAADAAALAAAAELPLEAAAQLRALEYLAENDYDCALLVTAGGASCTDAGVYVNINGHENFQDNPDAPAPTRIEINTVDFADQQGGAPVANSAVRIRVRVTQEVPLYFMRLLGFPRVPVSGTATAENIKDLDLVLVFDRSGSMEFDTLCYGCWTPATGQEYPQGNRWPLRWDGPFYGPPKHCSNNPATPPTVPSVSPSKYYIAIEAEEYGFLSNDYHRQQRPGQAYTYWTMQRNGTITGNSYLGDTGAYGRDTQGAYILHEFYVGHSSSEGASGVPCTWADLNDGRMCSRDSWVTTRGGPYPAPRVDYEFTVPRNGTWYIWIRTQAGDGTGDANRGYGLYWGLSGGTQSGLPLGLAEMPASGSSSWRYPGVSSSWTWRRLGAGNPASSFGSSLQTGATYTLHLWAGSPGYAVDRIIITDYNVTTLPSSLSGKTLTLDNRRTDWACDPCDARFGGFPEGLGNTSADGDDPPRCDATSGPGLNPAARYRYNDDLFDDEQPFAGTAAAALRFARKLDPAFDQIGMVRYSSSAAVSQALMCLETTGCNHAMVSTAMYNALMNRSNIFADGSTNMPDGLEEGIRMLNDDGLPGAAHIIILMTDGQPNVNSGLDAANANCADEDLWPGTEDALDCSMFMARQALNQGIVIYGITLGDGADKELMAAIADMTGGVHLHAETPDRLDDIFDELYSRIFLRLVE